MVTLPKAKWRTSPGMKRLLTALDASKGASRFVGGAVRDSLLGLPVSDLDIATRIQPDEVVARLEKARIKAIPTGIAHGTVTAVSGGTVVEVTTLRSDVTTDGRRATVAFTDDWREDAMRRDFTINALYADPNSGEIFDYFGGLDDVEAGRICFIGEPLERIAEDHLRILRFFRFHARFGKGDPDPAALAACTARANDLMALSRERIADELLKLLGMPSPSATVAIMLDRAILKPVLPEIAPTAIASLDCLIAAERSADIEADPLRRLSALLPRDPLLGEKIAVRLKLSNRARKRLSCAAEDDLATNPNALAYRTSLVCATDRLLLANRPAEAAALQDWPIPKLPIGGGALVARGLTAGPTVARTLKAIEDTWVEAGFPTGDAFKAIVSSHLATAP
jgi:poly(A) polymerase